MFARLEVYRIPNIESLLDLLYDGIGVAFEIVEVADTVPIEEGASHATVESKIISRMLRKMPVRIQR